MAEKDFYENLAMKGCKGKKATPTERLAVEELQEINDKISDYDTEMKKVVAHLSWLKVKMHELERQKEQILSKFDEPDSGGTA